MYATLRARVTVNECGTATRTPQTLSILRRAVWPLRKRGAQLRQVQPLEQAPVHIAASTRVVHERPHEHEKCIRGKQRVAGDRGRHVAKRRLEQCFRGARRGKRRQERERPAPAFAERATTQEQCRERSEERRVGKEGR